ncbi:hypothetical protein F2P45_21770 [Massilia sp. CCM 8733]|uniref:DUF2486 domain-containing protein n=1 Tax=Massilia mucilaginosa TaxID=2609282 RepID=A0ABX0NXH6_9BURK|nr:hypothetical protein [Massilia mucilaginosa]NHZ91615.1 hypothetical protein [Massilia mucilaginosa]
MSQTRPFDPHIPVLTELFSDKGEALAEPAAERAPAVDGDPEWVALERRLSERIVQQLQGSVDILLEQRLRESLEQVLRQAIGSITAELRRDLQASIDGIVARAVAQELSTLQQRQPPP